MSHKKSVMLWLDAEKVEEIKKHYSLSKIVDATMDEFLADENQDLILTLQLNQIDAAIKDCEFAKMQAETTYHGMTERLAYLTEKRVRAIDDCAKAKEIALLTSYYSKFNRICINADFDIALVKQVGEEVIAKIKLIDPSFNALEKMRRYKALLEE